MSKARVQFTLLRYKNFMAVGEQWIEIDLASAPKTIIYGKNGSGKSTVYEALYFCLFNKAFRKINKPELVNNVNNKGLLVEVEFTIGKTAYKVVRGIKPNKFEIYRDGEMLDQTSASADYQTILEHQILRMGPKNSAQTMILGSKMYTPFMKLSASDRRTLVEEVLDIQIFSEMNTIAKLRRKTLNEEMADSMQHLETLRHRWQSGREHIDNLKARNQKTIETNVVEITRLEGELPDMQIALDDAMQAGLALKEQFDAIEEPDYSTLVEPDEIPSPDYSDLQFMDQEVRVELENEINYISDNSTKINGQLATLRAELSAAETTLIRERAVKQKDIDFYKNNPVCPTCKQNIADDFHHDTTGSIQAEIDALTEEYTSLETKSNQMIEKYEEIITLASQKLAEAEKKLEDMWTEDRRVQAVKVERDNEVLRLRLERENKIKADRAALRHESDLVRAKLEGEMAVLRGTVQTKTVAMRTVNARIEDLKVKNSALEDDADINRQEENLTALKVDVDDALAKMEEMDTKDREYGLILKLLKDDGIKARIIKTYIPVLNKLIRKYLDILGFTVGFTLDESFKETISVPGRRDLQYGSFSAGEQMRIDLALLFAMREIPIIKGGNTCNLMVFDEVADSALDTEGWDAFFTIIESITDVSNVYVISPKGDELTNRFNNSIVFKKSGAFTVMEID